jgi:hypothetical protein
MHGRIRRVFTAAISQQRAWHDNINGMTKRDEVGSGRPRTASNIEDTARRVGQ